MISTGESPLIGWISAYVGQLLSSNTIFLRIKSCSLHSGCSSDYVRKRHDGDVSCGPDDEYDGRLCADNDYCAYDDYDEGDNNYHGGAHDHDNESDDNYYRGAHDDDDYGARDMARNNQLERNHSSVIPVIKH